MLSKIRAFGQGLIPRSKGAGFILLILLVALLGMSGVARAAGVIPEMDLITSYSSTGGTPQFKDNNQDLIYKINQGANLTFSITCSESVNYKWQVMKGAVVINSSTIGNSFNWTVPNEKSTWEIHIEVITPEVAKSKGRDYLSWSITTSDLITVNTSQSIQTAIDTLPSEGGIVELLSGVHTATAWTTIFWTTPQGQSTAPLGVLISGRNDIIIRGQGIDSTTVKPDVGSAVVFGAQNAASRITFEDMKILGSTTGGSTKGTPILIRSGVSYCLVQGVKAECLQSYDGMNIGGAYILVTDCEIIGAYCHGIRMCEYSFDSHHSVIKNCIFRNWGIFGIKLENYAHDHLLENNILTDGGNRGMWIYSGSYNTTARNNEVSYGNTSTAMSGIAVHMSPGNVVEGNVVHHYPEGITVTDMGHWCENNIIRNNVVYAARAGNFSAGPGINIQTSGTEAYPKNVQVYSNTIHSCVGGIKVDDLASLISLKNNIVSNNSGYGISVENNNPSVTGSYNCLWANSSGNYQGISAGTGDISVDPLFVDPATYDFHLKSQYGRWNPVTSSWVTDSVTSPAIDAGDPASDYSKEPQPNGGRINMGAYGNTAEASKSGVSTIDINQDGTIDISDLRLVALHFGETTTSPYPRYDVNTDGTIDILDLRQVAGGM